MTSPRRRVTLVALNAFVLAAVACGTARSQTTGSGTPFQQNVNCTIASGASDCSVAIKVTSGDTLVIQSISAYRLGPNASTANAFLEAEYKNSLASFSLPQIPAATNTPFPGTALPLTAYAQSGNQSFIENYRGSASGQEVDYFTVSGYLIPN